MPIQSSGPVWRELPRVTGLVRTVRVPPSAVIASGTEFLLTYILHPQIQRRPEVSQVKCSTFGNGARLNSSLKHTAPKA